MEYESFVDMSKKNMIELPTSGYLYIIGDTKV